jgi:methylenetetrahydrofolate reductase (NADPH)
MRLSFEFSAPRNEKAQQGVLNVAERLARFGPEFYSVTYGAGGSTRNGTKDAVTLLKGQGRSVAPHLSIGGDSESQTCALLDDYRSLGIDRVVALRGDLPSGMGRARYTHNAEDLVRLIREHYRDDFHLEVACYPETHPDAKSPASDMEFFKRKVDAGADTAITQYFYNAPAYFNFVERAQAAGIDIPIYPGIMPITNYESILRFSAGCGADVPRWIAQHLKAFDGDDKSLTSFGVDVVTQLCETLLAGGAPGLHLYTLNRWGASTRICENLGLAEAA